MPYTWDDKYIESKADDHTDNIGFGEIGGIGQLKYHSLAFSDYYVGQDNDGQWLAYPVWNKENPLKVYSKGNLTGYDILTSLCNLARRIDDFSEKSYTELIVEWCRENMHPYQIEHLYKTVTADGFDKDGVDGDLVLRDSIFSFEDFMSDLGKLYNAARFYMALEGIVLERNTKAYNLYAEGRHFESFPFFEKYKHRSIAPDVNLSSANGDLLEEMKFYAEYEREQMVESSDNGDFETDPYDDYTYLQRLLVECIPDFCLRLKVEPKSSRYKLYLDVKSVFDIAWYTFARMLTEEPEPYLKGDEPERPEGIMISCKHCGQFIIRTAGHQQYCSNKECQKVRNALNQKEYRRRKSIEKTRAEKQKK
ncbi:MAG: hypothetical protein IJ435_10130 [Clostridia bacterium]|nr:hypothetical protein [Clostridia bacterium]